MSTSKVILVTGASSGFGATHGARPRGRETRCLRGHAGHRRPKCPGRRVGPALRRRARRGTAARRDGCVGSGLVLTARSQRSSRRQAASTSSSTMPATWCWARPRRSRQNRSRPSTTPTWCPPSASTALCCLPCARSATAWSSGWARRARAAARRRTWVRTSRPRRPRMRWRSVTPPSSPGSGSRRRSSCPARSRRAPTTSPMPDARPTIHIATAYEAEYAGLIDEVSRKLAELAPDDADPSEVARQIVKVVDMPKGSRPFRVYVDPADDGAEDVFRVGDRVRQWFYQRIGLSDLLSVSSSGSPKSTG